MLHDVSYFAVYILYIPEYRTDTNSKVPIFFSLAFFYIMFWIFLKYYTL